MLHIRVGRSPFYAYRLSFVNSKFTFSSALSRASRLTLSQRALLTLVLSVVSYVTFSGLLKPASAHQNTPSFSISSISTAEDFQAALNAAQFGDTIILQAGVTLKGNFVLPGKQSSEIANGNWIVIRTSADDALPPGNVRISPGDRNALARIESPNDQPAIRTESGTHHYKLIGIEITIAPEVMLNYGIVRLGEGNETSASSLPHDLVFDRCYIHGNPVADISRAVALNSASTDIINSRISDIHGIGFDSQAIAGWNGPGPFNIVNNYLEAAGENVMFGGADPKIDQLVPSNIQFRSNHVFKPLSWKQGIFAPPAGVTASGSSSSGSLMPGVTYYYLIAAQGRAGYSTVATSMPSQEVSLTLDGGQFAIDLGWQQVDSATEYRVFRTSDSPDANSRSWVSYTANGQTFSDNGNPAGARTDLSPPSAATKWSVKNLFELKNARQVVAQGNVFENNWVDAQAGFAIQFTVRNQDGNAPWSVIEDLSFTDNVIRHSAAGINLLGRDDLHPSQQLQRADISDNFFLDIGGSQWGGNGRFLQITDTVGVRLDHNTIFQTGNLITAYGTPNQGFVFTNNIGPHNQYGIIGDGIGSGNTTLDHYFPSFTMKKNIIVGAQSGKYPDKNFYPSSVSDVGFSDMNDGNYALVSSSRFKNAGTKSRDIGVDFALIDEIAKKVIDGTP